MQTGLTTLFVCVGNNGYEDRIATIKDYLCKTLGGYTVSLETGSECKDGQSVTELTAVYKLVAFAGNKIRLYDILQKFFEVFSEEKEILVVQPNNLPIMVSQNSKTTQKWKYNDNYTVYDNGHYSI